MTPQQGGAVLLVLASPEYLRFFDTTVAALSASGRRVHVVVNDAADHKPIGLEGAEALPVAGVTVMPAARTFWADTAYAFRATVDFLRFLHPDFAGAAVLRGRIKRKVLPAAFQWLDRIPSLPPRVLGSLLNALRACERAIPIDPRVLDLVRAVRPELVIVSPLVDAASAQVDWVKAATSLGIPSALAVASWDNLTNKGLMRVPPDRVFVWNDIQRAEAVRYHGVAPEQVATTGAPVFDRWFHARPSRSREAFCAAAGLSSTRPFVLFTGSSAFIARGDEEVEFVRRWIAALRSSAHPETQALSIVVRPHPYNVDAWAGRDLGEPGDAAIWPRSPFNAASEEGRADFFDSLYYAAAVVGINTSAMIEAAIVGRPVLTVTDFATQGGTLHFRYLLPEHGGAVLAASTFEEHCTQLAQVVRDPDAARARAEGFVASFVRPHGLHEEAAPRLVKAIEEAAAIRRAAAGAGAAAVALRPVMALFGVWTAAVERLAGPDPFAPMRKSVLHPYREARKHTGRALAVRRERIVRAARIGASRARRGLHVVRGRARALPAGWKRCRRAVRQARYTVGVLVRGGASAGPRKP